MTGFIFGLLTGLAIGAVAIIFFWFGGLTKLSGRDFEGGDSHDLGQADRSGGGS